MYLLLFYYYTSQKIFKNIYKNFYTISGIKIEKAIKYYKFIYKKKVKKV